jgi:arylsulfatase A-like enzyme
MRRPVTDARSGLRRRAGASSCAARTLLACLAGALLAAGCAPPSPREQLVAASGWPAPVVLIVIDTLRLDHTSLGGYVRDTTPFLTELSHRAVVFDQARAASSWTRPSVASLFTSRLPASHGCEGRLGRVAPGVTLLPELLHDVGYDTRAVQANGNLADVYGFDRGFTDYRFVKGRPMLPYADAAFLRAFVENSVHAMKPPPFFFYVQYVDPHDPYLPHPERDWNPGYTGTFDGSERSLGPFRLRRPSAANLQRAVDLYDGEVAWVDDQLRSLFAWLGAQGTLDHSWVVITSDHGEGLWTHVIQGHADEVYEQQLRVPLLLLPPGGLQHELHVPEPFPLVDLAPTLLDLLGLPPCESFDGRSWAPHLLTGASAPVRPVISQTATEGATLDAIADGRFKLIVDRVRGRSQLFDLQSDPLEAQPLDPRGPEAPVAERLSRELEAELQTAHGRRPQLAERQLDEVPEEVRMQLQALGYVHGGK